MILPWHSPSTNFPHLDQEVIGIEAMLPCSEASIANIEIAIFTGVAMIKLREISSAADVAESNDSAKRGPQALQVNMSCR